MARKSCFFGALITCFSSPLLIATGSSRTLEISILKNAIATGLAPRESDHFTIGPETLTPATASKTRSPFLPFITSSPIKKGRRSNPPARLI